MCCIFFLVSSFKWIICSKFTKCDKFNSARNWLATKRFCCCFFFSRYTYLWNDILGISIIMIIRYILRFVFFSYIYASLIRQNEQNNKWMKIDSQILYIFIDEFIRKKESVESYLIETSLTFSFPTLNVICSSFLRKNKTHTQKIYIFIVEKVRNVEWEEEVYLDVCQ